MMLHFYYIISIDHRASSGVFFLVIAVGLICRILHVLALPRYLMRTLGRYVASSGKTNIKMMQNTMEIRNGATPL